MTLVHLHLVLNHVPVVGTFVGIALLLVALARRSRELTLASFGVFVASAAVTVPVYLTGEPAEDRVERLAGVSGAVIERHEERRRRRLRRRLGPRRGVADRTGARRLEQDRRPGRGDSAARAGGRRGRFVGVDGQPRRPDPAPGDPIAERTGRAIAACRRRRPPGLRPRQYQLRPTSRLLRPLCPMPAKPFRRDLQGTRLRGLRHMRTL